MDSGVNDVTDQAILLILGQMAAAVCDWQHTMENQQKFLNNMAVNVASSDIKVELLKRARRKHLHRISYAHVNIG